VKRDETAPPKASSHPIHKTTFFTSRRSPALPGRSDAQGSSRGPLPGTSPKHFIHTATSSQTKETTKTGEGVAA
jgi:hypothetical protein